MDVVNAILKPVVDSLMVPAKKHIGYAVSCTEHFRKMKLKKKELDDARQRVEEKMNHNRSNNLMIPYDQVNKKLEEVRTINDKIDNIPGDDVSCFSFKIRHKVGKEAFEMSEEIERVTAELSRIIWTDDPIPLGVIDSMKPSTSTALSEDDDFESRELTFINALKSLEPNEKSRMIALCGMGGVGKTTMMEKLKMVAQEKKFFHMIVKVVIGEVINTINIQDAVADYFGEPLTEKSISARADKLRISFEKHSDGGKNKILVILDDVWKFVNLKDIGLSPLPNQGAGFKFLLTSRDSDVCSMMGVGANSIFKVEVLKETESQSLFSQFVRDSDDVNLAPDFQKIGDDIVHRCQGLPIAIKTIAMTLKGKSKSAWENALASLQHYNLDEVVNQVFEVSYNNLKSKEAKSIFLLCGLYPEDFDIPMEELVRYGWGSKLFEKVYNIREARNRLNTLIEELVNANLLIKSDGGGCIKMHDLVLSFVVGMFSKKEHDSIVSHGDKSQWPTDNRSDSCKRISLTCNSAFEFPCDFKFPNLSFLKLKDKDELSFFELKDKDESVRFPDNFYEQMEKLQVIAYEGMGDPLLPRSPQCSTMLRTLSLHKCSLEFDISAIGNLSTLEVLSFANSSIQKLPSTIGNLKKLRLLDITRCQGVNIDDGVLGNLVKLEELYMRAISGFLIEFNFNELVVISKNVTTLEIEFFDYNDQLKNWTNPDAERFRISLKNMSCANLERFNISLGPLLGHSDNKFHCDANLNGNTLMLITNRYEIIESIMNELFEKTEVLYLQVNDMTDFGVEVKSPHSPPRYPNSCYNLRVLLVSGCADLIYLLTPNVATALSKLEYLEISECPMMEEIMHVKSGGAQKITFPKLKKLIVRVLPKLSGFCNSVKVIELPLLEELKLCDLPSLTSIYPKSKAATSSVSSNISTMKSFFTEEVLIPKLEKLSVKSMKNLKGLGSCKFGSNLCILSEIRVENCESVELEKLGCAVDNCWHKGKIGGSPRGVCTVFWSWFYC